MLPLDRRAILSGAGAGAASLSMPAAAQTLPDTVMVERELSASALRNVSAFRTVAWRNHFRSLERGAILVDIDSRALHMWEKTGAYHLYPSSVPQTDEMTRRGRTTVVQKVVDPTWRPTPNMRRRNPAWPAVVGPGPDNPLGPYALYLGWTYYRIHGTHDPRKIGRRSSSGCIGLYNPDIPEVFAMARVGTQVLLI